VTLDEVIATGMPAGTTVYYCPLSACGWVHPEAPITPDEVAVTFGELAADVIGARLAAVEDAVREHLETHTLLEWVQEITRLRSAVEAGRHALRQVGEGLEALAAASAAVRAQVPADTSAADSHDRATDT
jgi:hypothetical protein